MFRIVNIIISFLKDLEGFLFTKSVYLLILTLSHLGRKLRKTKCKKRGLYPYNNLYTIKIVHWRRNLDNSI